jgi:hypothetical protein
LTGFDKAKIVGIWRNIARSKVQAIKRILLIIALSMTLNLVSEQRCANLKDILVDKDNQWQPLVDKKGKAIDER